MKNLKWLASSKKDLMQFPLAVRQEIGFALHMAQCGEKYSKAKPFKGCGAGVFEIALEFDSDAYRSVYILNLDDAVYVVHCFQKKSKRGIKTPKEEIDLIKKRLRLLNMTISKG